MFTEDQLTMARLRKGQSNGKPSNEDKPVNSRGGNSVRWINVHLSDDDSAFLAESPAEYSQLAAMACELVANGYGLTVKPMDGGDSVMACITGQCSTHPDVICGVSGFASNVRDALLVLLYKFDDKLGGELPLPDDGVGSTRARFR